MKKILLLALLLPFSAQANIVCKVNTQMGTAKVEIASDSVTVSGAGLSTPEIYTNLQYSYDGHETAMITAAGLAISYENWYGCIHNAHVTANFRDGDSFIESVIAGQCAGGSTPDRTCRVNE